MELELDKKELINNRYKIQKKIGEGGIGFVYQAIDIKKNKEIVIKFLKPWLTSAYIEDVIRFKHEIEMISRLNHPNIIKIFDSGEYKNISFVVMELLEGINLKEYLDHIKKLSLDKIITIIIKLTETLEFIHNKGIIHRDIKPGNIFIIEKQESLQLKLLDFGVPLIIELKSYMDEKDILGTFGYMSPEATGIVKKIIDERSDLYSLGVIFYKLLTHKLPFQAHNLDKLLHEMISTEAISFKKIDTHIPVILIDIIKKLLNKDKDLRYQSAKGLIYDLERFKNGERDFNIGENDQKIKLSYYTKLIGRESELNKLKDLVDKAWNNQGTICFVSGEPGLGKTRLVEALKEYLFNKGYLQGGFFVEGRCLSLENKIPYQPFKEAINEYIKKVNKLNTKDRLSEINKIKLIVNEDNRIIINFNPLMHELLGNSSIQEFYDSERDKQRFLKGLANFFLHLGKKGQACILFLDDLHWADEGTLLLLKEIAAHIGNSNLAIVATYRAAELIPDHHLIRLIHEFKIQNNFIFEQIELNRLSKLELNKLVAVILGEKENTAKKLADYLMSKSNGNPYFAITILKELLEKKTIIWKNGLWQQDWPKIYQLKIESNIVDMVLLKIKHLDGKINHLLKVCSVIGNEFMLGLLYDLLDEKENEIILLIDQARNMQFLEASPIDKGKFLFIHEKIRAEFYDQLKKEEKKSYHLKVGSLLEKNYFGRESEVVFELVHHFSKGEDQDKVLKYIKPAAEKAKKNYDNHLAIKFYKKGVEILEEKGMKHETEWINLQDELSELYLLVGMYNEAIEITHLLLPLKKTNLEKAQLYKKCGIAFYKKGDWENSLINLNQGLILLGEMIPANPTELLYFSIKELLWHFINNFLLRPLPRKNKTVLGNDIEKIQIYTPLNWIYILSNQNMFTYCILRTLNIGQSKIGKSKELAMSITGYASLGMSLSFFKRALKYYRRGLRLWEELSDEIGIGQCYLWLGVCHLWLGQYKVSQGVFEKAESLFEQRDNIWELGMVINHICNIYTYISSYHDAIDCAKKYLEISTRINDYYGISTAYITITQCYIETGDYQKANDFFEKSLNLSEQNKLQLTICRAYINKGFLELEKGYYKEAVKALEIAQEIDQKNSLIKDYTVILYTYLAYAYLEEYIHTDEHELKIKKPVYLKKIKVLIRLAEKKAKKWINHYPVTLRVKALYFTILKKYKPAKKYFLKSITLLKELGRKYEQAKSYFEFGFYYKKLKKEEKAKFQWYKAYTIFKQINAKEYLQRCINLLGVETKNETEDVKFYSSKERFSLERRMAAVLNTSRYLSSLLDLDELLEKIMDKTIELVGAERGIIFLYNDDNSQELKLKARVLRNIANEQVDVALIYDKIIKKVERTKYPLIIEDASVDKEYSSPLNTNRIEFKSVLCTPIITKSELLGIIYLDNHLVSGLFKDEDLKILELVSSQAGISIENASLYKNLKEQERLNKEMEIASRIQTAILPVPPQHSDLIISATMLPAEEVGGDYYDIITDKKNNLWIAIGDVTGHGITPGLIMMMAQSAFSANIKNYDLSPREALNAVNRVLYENINNRLNENHYMTMGFIKYLGNSQFIYSSAGHVPLILYQHSTHSIKMISSKGIFLGLEEDIIKFINEVSFTMEKDDILVVHTDGISESMNKVNEEMLDFKVIHELIINNAEKDVEEIRNKILNTTLEWSGNNPTDDMTLIIIKRK